MHRRRYKTYKHIKVLKLSELGLTLKLITYNTMKFSISSIILRL